MKYIYTTMMLLCLFSCKSYEPLVTVNPFNIDKYQGKWYEIGRFPNRFEKDLTCVTADYQLKKNGKVAVTNSGQTPDGKIKTAHGTARIPNKKYPAQLKVTFFWPFSGDYYVIDIDKEYTVALVGNPSRKYLWILAKTKTIDDKKYSALLQKAKTAGFDITKMIKINQDCKR